MKLIIRSARELFDEAGSFPKIHKLRPLWDVAEPLLRRVAVDRQPYSAVEECLIRFDELDPTSESSRYPVASFGDRSFSGVYNLDLGQVSAIVGRLSMFFDCVLQNLSVRLDVKSEIEEAYRTVW